MPATPATAPASAAVDRLHFPPGFLWGAATAAYQIEGAVAEDGRAPSIWDTFSRTPGAIDNGDTGDTACDHYHRWPEDLALMKGLGTDAYRLSIAWPRVVPGGDGPVNAAGLDFYDRLVDALLDAGIAPSVTLYHWDLPQALQDRVQDSRGGWTERATAEHLAAYASVVAERLGDRVTQWTTLNEPLCSGWIGHLEGRMAPGYTDLTAAVRASYHLLLGHGLATQAIRATAPGARVGLVTNHSTVAPASTRPEDIAAAARMDGHTNRWWLDPVYGRGFPADMRELYGVELPEQAGDMETIATPLDWHGLNYYFPVTVADDPAGPVPHAREVRLPDVPRTGMDWQIDMRRSGGLPAAPHRGLRGARAVRHRERLGLPRHRRPRRPGPRPRAHPLPGTAPGRLRRSPAQGRPARRVLRLVPPRQLRMGLRLRQALRPRPRRLRDPEADREDERPAVRGHHPRPPGDDHRLTGQPSYPSGRPPGIAGRPS